MQFHQMLVLISLALISLSALSHAQPRKQRRLPWTKQSVKPEPSREVQREDKKNDDRRRQQRPALTAGKGAAPPKSPFTPPTPAPTAMTRRTTTTTTTTTRRRTTRRAPPKPPVSWAKPPSPSLAKSAPAVTGSPFTPPSGAQRENPKPAMAPRKPMRGKKVLGKRPPVTTAPAQNSFLQALEARQRENADSVPPLSSIGTGRGRTSKSKVNKGRRRGLSRSRPEPVVYQDARHRDIHEPGPGEKVWSRYTQPPPRQWSPAKANARCGFQHYSPRTQICCDGHVLRRQGTRPACCGGVAYDKVYGKCCDGQVSLGSGTAC